MALLTVPQAAKMLGVSPRTVTYWIKDKKRLKATPAAHGHHKLLIEESEVERLLTEMAQEQPEREQGPAAIDTSLVVRVSELERRVSELEATIAGTRGEASFSPPQRATEAKTRTRKVEPPVEGAMQYWQFARLHGVPRGTFRDQIVIGSKRSGERVEAMREGDTYWLTPDQQLAAIEYWKRHGVPFTLPLDQAGED